VVQVGTRQIKTIERRSVLPPCVKQGRSERRPKRTLTRVQNPPAKINKRLTVMHKKDSCFSDVVPSSGRSIEEFVC